MRLDVPMKVHDAAMYHFSQWWQCSTRSGMGYNQAWAVTWPQERSRLYEREIRRAIIWAGTLPLAALALAILLHPALILIWPALASLQGLRLAFREGNFAALLSVLGKYAELIGIVRYLQRALRGISGSTVRYK